MGDPDRLRQSIDGGTRGKLTRATEALYWKPPEPDELSALGFSVEDYPPPSIQLFPENEAPFVLFNLLHTQWRMGPAGPVGLDYGVVFHELDRRGLSPEDYDDTMHALRIIERTALREMRKD